MPNDRQASEYDLHALQRNKQPLIMHQLSILPGIPMTQLINPITTPRKNQHNRRAQKPRKHLEPTTQPHIAPVPSIPQHIITSKQRKDSERENLEREPSERDIDPDLRFSRRIGGHPAAGALQSERDDVA